MQPEPDRGHAAVPAADRGGCAHGRDLPVGDHGEPVRQRLGLVHVVRGEDDRRLLGGERADQVPGRTAPRRIESCRRLVQEQQLWAAHDAEADIQPPLLPAGEGLHPGIGLLRQADQLDHLVNRARRRVVTRVAGQRLAHRQVRLHRQLLQHDPDPGPQPPPRPPCSRVNPEHLNPASIPGPEPLENLNRRRLPRAIGPQQGEYLAPRDLKVHARHGTDRAV